LIDHTDESLTAVAACDRHPFHHDQRDAHIHGLSLYFVFYNFCRAPQFSTLSRSSSSGAKIGIGLTSINSLPDHLAADGTVGHTTLRTPVLNPAPNLPE
jgi:hypothetical protein